MSGNQWHGLWVDRGDQNGETMRRPEQPCADCTEIVEAEWFPSVHRTCTRRCVCDCHPPGPRP